MAFLPKSKHLLISWLQSPSAVILEPKKIKSVTVSTFPHPFAMKDAMILVLESWVLRQLFHSPLSPSSRGSLIPLHFLPCGIIYVPEVSYISPGNLDSSLWVIQPGILHDAHCINRVTVYSLDIYTPFPILNQSVLSSSNYCFLTHIEVSQETGKVV